MKLTVPCVLFASFPLVLAAAARPLAVVQDACSQTAGGALRSCRNGAIGDYWLERAKCVNLPTPQERLACAEDALDELADALEECDEQNEARLDVCASLGGGIYHPAIDPDDFVPVVDNPFFPLLPGARWVYESQTAGGLERVEVFVTHDTKEILGVECTVVRDIETFEGELVEDTFDYFAQDSAGNVWYFGELSKSFDEGVLASLHGSWTAGEEGAQPGLIMKAAPQVGDVYRQEFLLETAEDIGAVVALSAPVVVPFGNFPTCVETEDYSPLEPGALEQKFYAFGVGLVLELDPETGQRVELVEFTLD